MQQKDHGKRPQAVHRGVGSPSVSSNYKQQLQWLRTNIGCASGAAVLLAAILWRRRPWLRCAICDHCELPDCLPGHVEYSGNALEGQDYGTQDKTRRRKHISTRFNLALFHRNARAHVRAICETLRRKKRKESMREFAGKMSRARIETHTLREPSQSNALGHCARSTLCENLQGKFHGPGSRPTLCESLRSQNALGHCTWHKEHLYARICR